ncbi:MAG TPA: 3-oxoacyl-[acyl-carrier-protein] reductase [Bryobacteraceae bacterium]|nr:3-oxoacyl-[acyl-carrier-protein] reductase [Bryobacteraceae bacterium]HOQ47000.1 3-oxoacyl-[acyl-carrier-protein] reductase [Bryobacteraceae bacterium]HPU73073.1 3-oxoacyl-[acyl-carrier-protein] reductase [Bryobacteraceae bacterium]
MTDRIAFVTGASRGIGRAIALTLAKAGARVVVASNEPENNEKVAAEIREAGGQAVTVFLDLTSPDSIKQAFGDILKQFERVDILVNNAGITKDNLALRMKKEDWDLVLSINLTGAFLASQQVIPGMMKARWGRIINIASVVGQSGNPGQANYVASKAGIIGLTKTLAQELGSRNITVNAVAPGFIETDMTARLTEEQRAAMLAKVPLKRGGQPQDVANAVKFLASDDAAYITGHVLAVNGGMYM